MRDEIQDRHKRNMKLKTLALKMRKQDSDKLHEGQKLGELNKEVDDIM